MARKKNIDTLGKKAAALLGLDFEEVQKLSKGYTREEKILEGQSVIAYYEWRVERIEQQKNETLDEFFEREKAWRYKICRGCNGEFAYSYKYDDVGYCSLDCLDAGLRKIGLSVTYNRPLDKRWGRYYPAIVPAPALQEIEANLKLLNSDQPEASVQHSDSSQSREPADEQAS